MLRSLIPMSLLALALALPASARAETDPDEGPIFCDYMGSIGFLAALVRGDEASTSASSEEEYGCPKSSKPVPPARPPATPPTPPRPRPIGNQALH